MAKTTKRNSMNNMNTISKSNGGFNMQKTNNAYMPKSNKYEVYQANNKVAKILAGTAKLDDITDVKDEVIDFNKCLRKIKMIQTIYSAGSQVGACTVVAGNMVSFILTEETQEAFKKALKYLDKRDTHKPYKSVWVEGVNKFTFKFADGFYYVYFLVTNAEMELLKQAIEAMDYDSVTLEELRTLQGDLPPFVRSWQESSIDVSKDKSKVFVYNYDHFFSKIDVISTFLKSNMDDITINLKSIKDEHRAGKTDFNFVIELPLTDKVLPDMLGKCNMAYKEATEDFYNNHLSRLYGMSNREYYRQFANDCEQYPELALYINQVFTLIKQSFNDEAGLAKEQYALLRNAIYTKAVEYGVEDLTKVVRIAVSVAMRNVKMKDREIVIGEANVDNYKPFLVQRIFEKEYEVLRTNKPMTEELTLVWVEEGIEITEGQTVEFVSGFSTDDTVEVEELFTGIAYNRGGKLVYDIDVYEYEETKSVVTLETFAEEATAANLVADKGQFAEEYFNNNNAISVAGKNANVLANGKTLVGKTVSSPALKGNYTVEQTISFETTENRARVFLVVLA